MALSSPQNAPSDFAAAFNAGDIDQLMDFYEPEAQVTVEPGKYVSGHTAIREFLMGFLALKGTIVITPIDAVQSGKLALVRAQWDLTAVAPDGSPIELGGRTAEVIREQSGGGWRYVIDDPFADKL